MPSFYFSLTTKIKYGCETATKNGFLFSLNVQVLFMIIVTCILLFYCIHVFPVIVCFGFTLFGNNFVKDSPLRDYLDSGSKDPSMSKVCPPSIMEEKLAKNKLSPGHLTSLSKECTPTSMFPYVCKAKKAKLRGPTLLCMKCDQKGPKQSSPLSQQR